MTEIEQAKAERRWLMRLKAQGGGPLHAAMLLPLVSGLLLLPQAYLLALILDRAIAGGAQGRELLLPVLGLGGLLALRVALGVSCEQAGAAAAERIKAALRNRLFGLLIGRRPDWTAARPSGALAGAIVDQVEALDGFFARFLPAMVQASLLPLAFAAALLPFDWVVGLLFLVTAPLIPVFMALVGWGAEAASRAQAGAMTRLSGLFADRLRGIVTLRLFGREETETRAVVTASEDLRRRTLRVLRIAFLSSAVLEFFAALGVAGVALYIGLTYLGYVGLRATPLSLEIGLFCLLMAPEVYQPLRLLAAHYHDRAAAKAAAAEIAKLFETLPEIAARRAVKVWAVPAWEEATQVEIDGLALRTPDGGRAVLDDVRLKVPPGRHVALLGESGSGKSSLLEALAGLRDAPGGIWLDGMPPGDIEEAELRRNVAFLGQRPRLFHGTIADNIRLGRRNAGDWDVWRAAEQAAVWDFAVHLPLGLDTVIGEGGLGLSGGEGHRVALARLFLRNPSLILLDEPTAHLDAKLEARLVEALRAFAQGRTMIVATHSTALADRLDRSYRIVGGRLLPAPHHRNIWRDSLREGVA